MKRKEGYQSYSYQSVYPGHGTTVGESILAMRLRHASGSRIVQCHRGVRGSAISHTVFYR
jgi:hypothetical protein